jgi:hypothetical protein
MKYEDVVESVCGNSWNKSSIEEMQGGYGVAMMIAFMKGEAPVLNGLSRAIDVNKRDLDLPYQRLLMTGMFSKNFDAKGDLELLGKGFSATAIYIKDKKFWVEDGAYRNAWAHVAAIASGFIDRNIDKRKGA